MNWKIASIFSKTPANNGYVIQKLWWWVFSPHLKCQLSMCVRQKRSHQPKK